MHSSKPKIQALHPWRSGSVGKLALPLILAQSLQDYCLGPTLAFDGSLSSFEVLAASHKDDMAPATQAFRSALAMFIRVVWAPLDLWHVEHKGFLLLTVLASIECT